MTRYTTDTLDLRNCDNMELMAQFPDNHFALAIVDPPYGIGEDGGKVRASWVKQRNGTVLRCSDRGYMKKRWDDKPPPPEYFRELIRVSRNQIIWGENYFDYPFSGSGRIIWDKVNDGSSQSDAEIAYCSIGKKTEMVRFMWRGMLQAASIAAGTIQQGNKALNEKRIHPTQKPVALYKWLLAKYAKPGDNILDTHLGSCSIAIACHYAGHHLTGCELDPDYFATGIDRVTRETAQEAFAFSQPLIPPPRETSTALSLF